MNKTWIYLSPHPDDVALSCGGLVWEQAQAGDDVSVWTVCAGDPPGGELSPFAQRLHTRWETGPEAIAQRRLEDAESCRRMGAVLRRFALPDCIYRRAADGRFLYASEEALFGLLDPAEEKLIAALAAEMALGLPPEAAVVCPLTLGGHVDHRLARAAAERLDRPLWFYADYPYVVRPQAAGQLEALLQADWELHPFPLSTQGLEAWFQSIAAHHSQLSTFWADLPAMHLAIGEYCQQHGGVRLWRKNNPF